MKKIVLPLVLTACTASLAFASANLSKISFADSQNEPSQVELSDDKALAIKQIMDESQAQKREILRQAREQIESLQKQKLEKLAQLLDGKEIKHLDSIEASWREEYRAQRMQNLTTGGAK